MILKVPNLYWNKVSFLKSLNLRNLLYICVELIKDSDTFIRNSS